MDSSRRVFDIDDPTTSPYRLLTALVVPRPIAWVSTLSAAGVGNLAPHSFFTVACADPAVVQFTSIGRKDTLRNVEETGEFTVSLASEELVDQVNATSTAFGPEVDEADATGVVMEPSEKVAPPRVRASPASIECTLRQVVDLGTSWLVLGTVRAITVRESALDGTHPLMSELRPVSRLGRDEWGLPPEVVALERP
ncbi:flavin reductase family protein [Nocardioides zeicaulis]|uniref:Flavin reductase family protein n=1 Tax=Nocardioides zeicaulis TaxID=1776857 RepID=A0ABV6E4C5_9ACTN